MAGKSLGTLTLDLLVKTGSFIEGFSKAERESKKFTQNLKRNLGNAAKAFGGLVAGATAATAALIKTSINTAAALGDVSQITGITVEELSALKYAAESDGIAFEALTGSMTKFLKTIHDARDSGSGAALAFKSLGVELRNAEGTLKSSDELLLDVADRFALIEDGATKAAYAQALFGKSGADMIPFLNKGRDGIKELTDEAERFGLVISGETANRADEFNDNLFRLRSIIAGTGLQLAEQLLPKMVEFTELVKDPATQKAIGDIVTGIANIALAAVEATIKISEFATGIRDLTEGAAEFLAKQFNGPALDDAQEVLRVMTTLENQLNDMKESLAATKAGGGSETWIKALEEGIARTTAELEAYQSAVDMMFSSKGTPAAGPREFVGPPLPPPDPIDPDALEAAARLEELTKERIADMQREIALAGDVTELERVRYEMNFGALKGLDDASRVTLEKLASELDLNTQLAKVKEERLKQEQDQQRAAEQYDDMVENLERERDLYGEVTRAEATRYELASGNLTHLTAEQGRYLLQLAEELDVLDAAAKAEEERQKQLEEQEKAFEEFGLQAARNIQDAMVDAFMGVESNWSETLHRMALELATSQLLKAAFGALAGSENKTLATLGGFFAGAFAGGGTIPAGQFGLVGEDGAELVTGPAFVVGQKKTEAMMSGSRNNYFSFSMPGITNANEANRASSAIMRGVRTAIDQAGRYD